MQATTPLPSMMQQPIGGGASSQQQQSSYQQAAYQQPAMQMSSSVTPSYQGGVSYQQTSYQQNGYQAGAASVSNSMSYAGSQSAVRGTPAGPERVQSTRKISSTIVNEQMMGPAPQDYPVREVEVPGPVQEIVTHVPRKEVIETEKRVPKYEYEYVDKIVEVPRIEYVDRVVEVPKYQEVIVEKKVPQIVDVPREVVREVKVPRVNYVEKTVEVPGEVIEVPKPYTVEQKVEFTRYTDKKKPVVVAQSVKPVIVEGAGVAEVDVYEYEPEVVPVDVHVVKGVQAQVQAGGVVETTHRVVTVPSAQYNTVLQQLNTHLSQVELQKLPYMTERGQVTFLGERVIVADPQPGVMIQGLDMSNMTTTYVDQASRNVLPVNDPRVNGAASSMVNYGGASANYSGATYGVSGGMTGGYYQQQTTTTTTSNYPSVGYTTETAAYKTNGYPTTSITMQPTSTYLQNYSNVSSSPLQYQQKTSTVTTGAMN